MNFFKNLFTANDVTASEPTSEHKLQLITATLLIEISKADFSQDDSELFRIKELLSHHFDIQTYEADKLIQQATEESDKLVSLQHLTRELNETLSQKDKVTIIELMWQVVYADGVKDCYEEHLMRQVSDLLYVSHANFIKARHKAELI